MSLFELLKAQKTVTICHDIVLLDRLSQNDFKEGQGQYFLVLDSPELARVTCEDSAVHGHCLFKITCD